MTTHDPMPRAPYMAWAKSRPHAACDLALSNVLACRISDLEGAAAALDFSGTNDDGYPPLLEAIATRYGVRPEQVATAIGTSGANFLVALALVGRGDDVLVETPAYDPLLAIPRAVGANVVRFGRQLGARFEVDPDAVRRAMTPATRLIIITHPHNPTGGFTTAGALQEVASIAAGQGAFVLVDEVYLDAARGCGTPPAARLGENVITTNSLTKSYGLAMLRCGWAIAAPPIAERIRRARDIVDGTGPIPAERLAVIAFQQLERLAARASALIEPNVATLRDFLASQEALEGFVERGTVAFPRLRSGADASALASVLLRDHDTAIVPGRFFEAPSHFRVGLAIRPEVFAQGLVNLAQAIRRL